MNFLVQAREGGHEGFTREVEGMYRDKDTDTLHCFLFQNMTILYHIS